MSGGPVINGSGEVVGINVAVSREEVMMTPTVGILDAILKEEE
jgi:S1-C subfamily serine protease